MKLKHAPQLAALLALSACASSSGVYAVGSDTYRVTATAITSFGGEATAKGSAVKQANEMCAKQGKTAVVVGETADAQFTQGSASVTFKCS
jgi:hypothetical protein